ncbi:MAG: peptidylprolyl isomerase [Spirochaetales bacterium]|nr:peptidylprolyl isomerase [Spirochaetales bacterium]
MKKIVFCLLLIAAVIFPAAAQIIDQPAATVNLTKPEYISIKQLDERVLQYQQLTAQGLADIPTDPLIILDSMVQEILIKQAADEAVAEGVVYISDQKVNEQINSVRKSLDAQQGSPVTDVQFQELVLRETGLSIDGYSEILRDQLITQEYIKYAKAELFEKMPMPTEKQIEDQYRKNATSLTNPEMVRLNEIFIDFRGLDSDQKQKARERVETALRNIQNGVGSFDDMVLQYSDDAASRYNGGDKGYFTRNDPRTEAYGTAYFDTIFSIDTGSLSNVIESNVGYHIVKITDHRDARILQLDDTINPVETTTVREFIRNLLLQEIQNQVLKQAVKELTSELKEQAEIKIYDNNVKK